MTAMTPAEDLAARWVPDPLAVEVARAVLGALPPGDFLAAIPMFQPGKSYGVWLTGQEVVTVHGAVFWGLNRWGAEDCPASYSWARNAAAGAARAGLGDRRGTVAWATVNRDGTWAVFGDFGRQEEV